MQRIAHWCFYGVKLPVSVVKKVVKEPGFSVDKIYLHIKKSTLLYIMVESGQSPEAIEVLLKAGADPDWRNASGHSIYSVCKDRKVRNLLKKYSRSRSDRK